MIDIGRGHATPVSSTVNTEVLTLDDAQMIVLKC